MAAGSVDERRAKLRIRLTAALLAVLAGLFYLGFIALTVWGS